MSRHITLSVTGALLAIGLVGCAADNPTRDSDIVRDSSVSDRVRQGEALRQSNEQKERSTQNSKERNGKADYGYDNGGGSRKRDSSRNRNRGNDFNADEKDSSKKKANNDDRFSNALAGLMGNSGKDNNMGMWMGALVAGLLVKGGDILKGGAEGAKALLGGNSDSKKESTAKNSENSKDQRSSLGSAGALTASGNGSMVVTNSAPANSNSAVSANIGTAEAPASSSSASLESILRFDPSLPFLAGTASNTPPASASGAPSAPVAALPQSPVAQQAPSSAQAAAGAPPAPTSAGAAPTGPEVLRFAMKAPEPLIPAQSILGSDAVDPKLEEIYWKLKQAGKLNPSNNETANWR